MRAKRDTGQTEKKKETFWQLVGVKGKNSRKTAAANKLI